MHVFVIFLLDYNKVIYLDKKHLAFRKSHPVQNAAMYRLKRGYYYDYTKLLFCLSYRLFVPWNIKSSFKVSVFGVT